MEHKVFSSYYALSLDGKVDPISCINREHPAQMVPHWNVLEERTEFRCLVRDCDYKIIPGLAMYQDMMEKVYYAN